MTDRIELTEEVKNKLVEITGLSKFGICFEAMNENKIKQMLDDHDIVSNLGVNPRQLIQEWKEKAEKYEACSNLINQVNELLQENKQLKEVHKMDVKAVHNDIEGRITQLDAYLKQNDNLKQKLKKIKEFYATEESHDAKETYQFMQRHRKEFG